MRIISGRKRGHKLLEFEGEDVRPTTDRVKESVFNLIQGFVPDAVCLDMFAGSGASCNVYGRCYWYFHSASCIDWKSG